MDHINEIKHKNRVEIVFIGSYDHDFSASIEKMRNAMQNVKSADGHFDILADFSSAGLMPQERAEASEELIAWAITNGLRKSANVMDKMLMKMQVQRVSEGDDRFGYFESRTEAEAWLDQ